MIAYIKFYSYFPSRAGKSVLCIYLKKGDELNKNLKYMPSNLQSYKVAGFTPIKEFYEPDYQQSTVSNIADARTTLCWKPLISLTKDQQKISIPFYNNDYSKRLKIVLEGVSEDGRIIRVERIIE